VFISSDDKKHSRLTDMLQSAYYTEKVPSQFIPIP